MRAACRNAVALKLRPGPDRVTHHSPRCRQNAALDNFPPRDLHAFPPCLEAAQKTAGEDRVCHATVAGSEATDGTPALFRVITVYTCLTPALADVRTCLI